MTITGKDLIAWGFTPGKWFAEALNKANALERGGFNEYSIRQAVEECMPPAPTPLQDAPAYRVLLDTDGSEHEEDNRRKVIETMDAVVKTPTVRAAAVMPDACPAGPLGTIPVGGVVAAENAIHPGMHSADICCSVAISSLGDVDPRAALDRAQEVTHFGGGGRNDKGFIDPPAHLYRRFDDNRFLNGLETAALEHMGTQGDGNHFLFVGTLRSTGETCIVTHHGSRKPGAMLYKRGMACAEKYRRELSPDTLKQNAWIPADTDDGREYWRALQTIREWTKCNHFCIHDALGFEVIDRFWNEHNFVFKRGDLFYHGKGATPAWKGFASDSSGLTLIPLNMAEPVLVARGLDNLDALGFAPHGAGRNFSRRAHVRSLGEHDEQDVIAHETRGVDARFYSGYPDLSELPSAYKSASAVRSQIESYGLAEIVDEVVPYGCIMAGEWTKAFQK